MKYYKNLGCAAGYLACILALYMQHLFMFEKLTILEECCVEIDLK